MASKGLDRSPSSSSGIHNDLCSSVLSTYCDSATLGLVLNYNVNIHVPIGPLFQVEVPEWTGGASESDPKWLGTRVWPSEKKENKFMIERDRIGKGRQDSCGCHIRDSIQCVRSHVAEKRLKAKLELGFAFYRWKFDKMGEEVAFSWKEEEEKMFSCIAYRNRVTLRNNNDDDEEEIGAEEEAIRKGIGHKPTNSYTSILISPKKKEKKSRYSPQFSVQHFANIKKVKFL
ncbi:uncharacterized protein LOC120181522 isoform X2 [Hibiscus syriacus]|uniref:uncharacterized protein LOC120181522 isoform X2 n=1 Tax=Hibiscus syriacus TaxID=106335 RepID=UPI001924DED9|nr:uncharacterized protein LOC120181522 isoform X2 [Hibiscus syriacus]